MTRQPKRPPPDPNAVHHFLCNRCQRHIWTHGIARECMPCIDRAVKAFGLGPIQGEVSGS